jgi:anti-sigma regulatory factor (Ser/Thr protein kinase)/CheY-like chemotaxis protein
VRNLRILYAGPASVRVTALMEVLRHRGHEVQEARGIREILGFEHDRFDALVLDAGEERGARDLLLLEEVSRAGVPLPVVLVSGRTSDDLCERAFELEVASVVQGAFEPRALAEAVERAAPEQPDGRALGSERHEYAVAEESLERSVADVAARLETLGVAAPHLARVLCATAELVDNVLRHAHPEGAPSETFTVETRVRRSHVHVVVRDAGRGFDARRSRLESLPAALPSSPLAQRPLNGLSRVAALAEELDVLSDEKGSTVRLDFELYPVRFDGGELPTAAECLPDAVRRRIASLPGDQADPADLHPVMGLALHRLLGRVRATRKAITQA